MLVWYGLVSPLWDLIDLVYHSPPKVSALYSSSRLTVRSSRYLMSSVMAVVQKGLGEVWYLCLLEGFEQT